MHIRFTTLAQQELEDAIAYYDSQAQGLGKKFKMEIEKSVLHIADFPQVGRIEKDEIRCYVISKFPYNLIYVAEDNNVLILAIAHQRRQPNYWMEQNKK